MDKEINMRDHPEANAPKPKIQKQTHKKILNYADENLPERDVKKGANQVEVGMHRQDAARTPDAGNLREASRAKRQTDGRKRKLRDHLEATAPNTKIQKQIPQNS